MRQVPPTPNHEAGWDTNPELVGSGSGMVAYDWAAPFRGDPDGVRDRLLAACREVLAQRGAGQHLVQPHKPGSGHAGTM